MIAIRNMVNLCISIDHRILDGVQTGRFMSQVKSIESYSIGNNKYLLKVCYITTNLFELYVVN